MTEHEQRIALCEWFGWKVMYEKPFFSPIEPTTELRFGFWDTEDEAKKHYADTDSLDVLHEMEGRLLESQLDRYLDYLCNEYHDGIDPDIAGLVRLTAAQRREALLRTLGLWKDSPANP